MVERSRGAAYNGRDCIDFGLLAQDVASFQVAVRAQELGRVGHLEAAKELELLARTAFAHQERSIDNIVTVVTVRMVEWKKLLRVDGWAMARQR